MPPRPSIRRLAQELGLSVGTVSNAFRANTSMRFDTRHRVHEAASQMGYVHNPAVALVMSELRRGQHQSYRGHLGLLNVVEAPNPSRDRFHASLFSGASTRAAEFGYKITPFAVGTDAMPFRRMNAVLRARNISGVIVMPFEHPQDWPDLAWDHLSAVRMFNPLCHPFLHSVSADHHQLLLHGLERVSRLGYHRVGLFVRRATEARIHGKWSAAFHVYQKSIPDHDCIPPLKFDEFEPASFMAWFRRYRPDAIMGHHVAALDCLKTHEVRVPTDVGFINLNVRQEIRPCAGLDLRPEILGAAAADAVIAQINRNERGVPTTPHTIQIEGSWIDGPTLPPRGNLVEDRNASSKRRPSLAKPGEP